jgi:hypothetical protein
VQRTVREVGGANWPVLTRTTYGKRAVLMKVMLRARKLWRAIDIGVEDEDDDYAAIEAILHAVLSMGVTGEQGLCEACLGHPEGQACRVGLCQEGEGETALAGVRGTSVPRWRGGGGLHAMDAVTGQLARGAWHRPQ